MQLTALQRIEIRANYDEWYNSLPHFVSVTFSEHTYTDHDCDGPFHATETHLHLSCPACSARLDTTAVNSTRNITLSLGDGFICKCGTHVCIDSLKPV